MEYDRSRRGNACNRITVSRMISIWYSKSPLNGFFRLEYWENESFPSVNVTRGNSRDGRIGTVSLMAAIVGVGTSNSSSTSSSSSSSSSNTIASSSSNNNSDGGGVGLLARSPSKTGIRSFPRALHPLTTLNSYVERTSLLHPGLFLFFLFTGCKFPEEWNGRWFQSGNPGLVTVNGSIISNKGHCIEVKDDDKFLLYDT
ncbi:uncharacterized protein V1478_009268 [Vespula squamosa]|uniref:DUF7044 domain-containing protein n=1 Tax=Vespula squamosa TaxID=30214 RepID=A0ABD2ARW0_VESSQ